MPSDGPTPSDVLDALVEEAGEITTSTDREYARDGVIFATRPEENVFEFLLGEDIAEAALRTPDTDASSRGSEWVRFAPTDWNDMAFDRLEAWFRVAWRLAKAG